MTFRLRKGARRRVDLLKRGKVVRRLVRGRVVRAGRAFTVRAPAGGTHLRLRANRKHRTTTITLTLPR